MADISETNSKQKKKKSPRTFDFSKHSARKVALSVSYFGWNYYGFAAQESDSVLTIEAELFKALRRAKLVPESDDANLPGAFGNSPSKLFGWSRCGRTDKGVSAYGQVVSLYIRSNFPVGEVGCISWIEVWTREGRTRNDALQEFQHPTTDTFELKPELPYLSILNKLLPQDIRVIAWSPVADNFDARYDCTFRLYKYMFPRGSLDIPAMQEASRMYVGTHNFRNFCKIDPSKINETHIRDILSADIVSIDTENSHSNDSSQMFAFVVKGNAFLWHQVRCMMAVLFLVGRGLESADVVEKLMSVDTSTEGRPAYEIASEIPLVLFDCGFAESVFSWRYGDGQPENVGLTENKMITHLTEMWNDYATKACQLNSLLNEYKNLIGDVPIQPSPTRKEKYIPLLEMKRCASLEERKESNNKKRREQTGDDNVLKTIKKIK
ncbi:tRNA pseudouridine synthase 3 [Nowakowskiella sp. JEL0407]|nr:tRNA pseudouridine synthase 3 [Nowakowskiella sp. JEL0407]